MVGNLLNIFMEHDLYFKGHFYRVFGHECVWTQGKNPPTPHFLIPFKPSQSHKGCRFDSRRSVTSHFRGFDWQPLRFYIFQPQRLRSPYFSPRSSRCNVNNVSQAIPVLFGCKTEHTSLHFLPTSEDAVGAALVKWLRTVCSARFVRYCGRAARSIDLCNIACFVPLSVHLTPVCTAEHRPPLSQSCCFYQRLIAVERRIRGALFWRRGENAAHVHALQISSFLDTPRKWQFIINYLWGMLAGHILGTPKTNITSCKKGHNRCPLIS